MVELEIAVITLEDARRAVEGGADSLELLRDLANGGLTPPADLVRAVLDEVEVPVNVIVRPHARSFQYDAAEVDEILRDAQAFAALGAASIVFGAVDVDGRVDTALVKRVAEAIAPTPVTLHRALDTSVEPEAALNALIGIVPRVLTSGPAPDAWQGREVTRQWVESYGQHFRFVLSGAIRLEQLVELAAITRAHCVHIGGASRSGDAVDVEKVKRLWDALH